MGFPAGSTTDAIARILAEQVRAKLGQPIIVEVKPGTGAALGTDTAANAAPDGYAFADDAARWSILVKDTNI